MEVRRRRTAPARWTPFPSAGQAASSRLLSKVYTFFVTCAGEMRLWVPVRGSAGRGWNCATSCRCPRCPLITQAEKGPEHSVGTAPRVLRTRCSCPWPVMNQRRSARTLANTARPDVRLPGIGLSARFSSRSRMLPLIDTAPRTVQNIPRSLLGNCQETASVSERLAREPCLASELRGTTGEVQKGARQPAAERGRAHGFGTPRCEQAPCGDQPRAGRQTWESKP